MNLVCSHQYCKLRNEISKKSMEFLKMYRQSYTRLLWLTPCLWLWQYKELYQWYKKITLKIRQTVKEAFQIFLMARLGGETLFILLDAGLILPCEKVLIANFYKLYDDYQIGNFQDQEKLLKILHEARCLNMYVRNTLLNKILDDCFTNNLALLCGNQLLYKNEDEDSHIIYELRYCDALFAINRFQKNFERIHKPICSSMRKDEVLEHDWTTVSVWFEFFCKLIMNSFKKSEQVVLNAYLCLNFAAIMVDCELVTGLSKRLLHQMVTRFLECVESSFSNPKTLECIYYCCDLLAKDGGFFEDFGETFKSAIESMECRQLDFLEKDDQDTQIDMKSVKTIFYYIEKVKNLYEDKEKGLGSWQVRCETRCQETRQNLERWAIRLERLITQLPTKFGRTLLRFKLYASLVDLYIFLDLIYSDSVLHIIIAIQNYLKMFEMSDMRGYNILKILTNLLRTLPEKYTSTRFLRRRLLQCTNEVDYLKQSRDDIKGTRMVITADGLDLMLDCYYLTTFDKEDKANVSIKIHWWIVCFIEMLENGTRGTHLEAKTLIKMAMKAYQLMCKHNTNVTTARDLSYMESIRLKLSEVNDNDFRRGKEIKSLYNFAKDGISNHYVEKSNIHHILAKVIIKGCDKIDPNLNEQ